VFNAIHEANPSQKVLAYQYLQALPQIANGTANKVWIVPTELTRALEGMGGALGGLANMVGDLPSSTVDAGAVEREAAEAAEAAAAEAERVNAQVRAAEAQVSGDRAPKGLPAAGTMPPAAALGSADYNNAGEPERA
jgi:regulator of protease activity HflC (stomatin/prohibitin superfamily)